MMLLALVLAHVGDLPREIAAMLEEPGHALLEGGKPVDRGLLDIFACDETDQTDDRAHAQRPAHAPPSVFADLELIVVEAILFVPEAVSADGIHRVRDRDEVLEELRRHVLVRRILRRQLQRDG